MRLQVDLDRFAPITLENLLRDAELLTRVDRKYVVTEDLARRVLAEVDPATRILDLDGVRASAYESVYFDTPDLLSFHLAAHSRRRRFKVRTRTYLESESAFLEVKTRGARSTTVKDRIEYPLYPEPTLTDEARAFAEEALAAVGVPERRAAELRPTLTTRYRRATLVSPEGARCTVDTGIEWRDADGRVATAPRLVIVESKSPSAASGFDRALWRAGTRPVRISKYGTGLALLRPELPHAKWSRTLRGPLSHTATIRPELEESCSPAA